MTLKEAETFIKISSSPNEWADEDSEFHRNNPLYLKEKCIEDVLKAREIIIRHEERRRAAEIVARAFPAVYTHLSGHDGYWVREDYMLKMKKGIEKEILDSL